MHYSLEALFVSMIIMCIILLIDYYTPGRKHLIGHTIFYFFIGLGLLDVSLDIITAYMIEWRSARLLGITYFCLTLFFSCQVVFPYLFYVYSARLKDETMARLDPLTRFMCIPTTILLFLVLFNPVTHMFYYFSADMDYLRGPFYLVIYYNAIIYVLLIFIRSFSIRKKNAEAGNIVMLFLFVSVSCVLYQLFVPHMLTTGLGIGLGIMALYMNISNPHEFKDYHTGAFNSRGLFVWLMRKNKPGFAVVIYFPTFSDLNKLYGIRNVDRFISLLGKQMVSQSEQPVFRISPSRFLLFADTKERAQSLARDLRDFLKNGVSVDNLIVKAPAKMCVTEFSQEIYAQKSILEYSSYLTKRMETERPDYMEVGAEYLMGFQYEREIERFLETAIDQDLFELSFQPIYSVKEKRFTQVEVLSRLMHPTLGVIPPSLFISIAEQKGDVDRITFLQFHRLCRFLKEHPALLEKLECIKFNLSPHELLEHNYGEVLPEIILSYGLPPQRFAFEVTETAIIEYSDFLKNAIDELLSHGCRLNMDDFGSGFANLNTVLKLPYESIKLDRSLLENICSSSSSAILYHDLIRTFHRLGFVVVSEGIESQEEYDLVAGWGVDLIQGYWFSKPVTEHSLESLFNF